MTHHSANAKADFENPAMQQVTYLVVETKPSARIQSHADTLQRAIVDLKQKYQNASLQHAIPAQPSRIMAMDNATVAYRAAVSDGIHNYLVQNASFHDSVNGRNTIGEWHRERDDVVTGPHLLLCCSHRLAGFLIAHADKIDGVQKISTLPPGTQPQAPRP